VLILPELALVALLGCHSRLAGAGIAVLVEQMVELGL